MRVRRTKTSKLGFKPSGVLAWLTSACAWTWTRMLSDAPSMGMGTLVAYAPVEKNTATSSILIELFIGSPWGGAGRIAGGCGGRGRVRPLRCYLHSGVQNATGCGGAGLAALRSGN